MLAADGCTVTGQQSFSDVGFNTPSALSYTKHGYMVQWHETATQSCSTCKSSTGKSYSCNCVTTYSYYTSWTDYQVNSYNFHYSFGHTNPPCGICGVKSTASPNATIGDYSVTKNDISSQLATEPAPFTLSPYGGYTVVDQQTIQSGSGWSVGDTKIVYSAFTANKGSFIGGITGNTITPFFANGIEEPFYVISSGAKSAVELVGMEQDRDIKYAWSMRGGAFAVLFIGFCIATSLSGIPPPMAFLMSIFMVVFVIMFISGLAVMSYDFINGVIPFGIALIAVVGIIGCVYRNAISSRFNLGKSFVPNASVPHAQLVETETTYPPAGFQQTQHIEVQVATPVTTQMHVVPVAVPIISSGQNYPPPTSTSFATPIVITKWCCGNCENWNLNDDLKCFNCGYGKP